MIQKKHKLKSSEIAKIQARFDMKVQEFNNNTLEELNVIYNTTKMSSTDKHALIEVVRDKQVKEFEEQLKTNNDGITEQAGNNEGAEA